MWRRWILAVLLLLAVPVPGHAFLPPGWPAAGTIPPAQPPHAGTVPPLGFFFAGRVLSDTWVDPGCFVMSAWGRPEMQMVVPRGPREHWYAITPAFGHCSRPQNPYRARIVVFSSYQFTGGDFIMRRGSLVCRMSRVSWLETPTLECNRHLRCNVQTHTCRNP